MDKKTILITGAASGIGRETALLFAKNGWFVGAFDVNESGLKTLEAEIGKNNCFTGFMDVIDPESVQSGIESFASKTEGKLDVLLNNAGILKFGLYENVDIKTHHRIVDVNFKGCLNCIYYALRHLKATPGSRIINMSSASSIYGIPDLSVYSATKHALSAMTEALNIELGRYGIHVCDIKPPYVKTPLLDVPEDVFSIKVMGVFMGPKWVAKTVWKAAHRKKIHWLIGATIPLAFLFWLLPFAFVRRFIVKTLTISPKQK
ncbi:MAG: SDR family oxidoreductase [Desulfobacterales bacterium]|jgi:NAD(P)-dependent dehydrogenase (short-subunit alcohol dehydrogenase family)|nr:SDR family oxidoreductase [Desulfobacterales bacterium]